MAEPTLTRRHVVVSIAAFVVLLPAWTGLQWLVRDRLGWSMWVVVVVLAAVGLAGVLVSHRSPNPELVAVARTAWIIGLIGALFALADAIDRSELLVIWVAAAVLLVGQLLFRWHKRRITPGRAAHGAP